MAGNAFARGPGHGARGACKAEVERHCSDVEPGEGRILECLENAADLSPECSEQLQKMQEHHEALRQACEADAQRLCTGKEGKDLHACMREHKDQVSDSCREAVRNARQGRHGPPGPHGKAMKLLRKACGDDAERLCPNLEREALEACMDGHRAELSQPCTEAIEQVEERVSLVKSACAGDAQRLCPDTQGHARRQCMKQYRDEVSEPCRAAVQAARGKE